MTIRFLMCVGASLFLNGCGTMNSNFSCNVTAGDSCLTIEQVDEMTHFADDAQTKPVIKKGMYKAQNRYSLKDNAYALKKDNQALVWIAPALRG